MFNYNLRMYRENAGLSQVELAKRVGLPYQTINKYENSDMIPRANALIKIAKALKISVDQLLGVTPEPAEIVEYWSKILNPYYFLEYVHDEQIIKISKAFEDDTRQIEAYKLIDFTEELRNVADARVKEIYNTILYKEFIHLLYRFDLGTKISEILTEDKNCSYDEAEKIVLKSSNPLNKD